MRKIKVNDRKRNFYVYELIDPDNDKVFYVGKGSKYRCKSHFKKSAWANPGNHHNPYLSCKMKELMEKNTLPKINIVKQNLNESEAYDLELELILRYGRKYGGNREGILLNISAERGWCRGRKMKKWTEERRYRHKELCKSLRKYDPTYEEIYNDFIICGMKRKEMAERYKVSEVLIKKRLQEHKITRSKFPEFRPRNQYKCENCGKIFLTHKSVKNRLHCSKECCDDKKRSIRNIDKKNKRSGDNQRTWR